MKFQFLRSSEKKKLNRGQPGTSIGKVFVLRWYMNLFFFQKQILRYEIAPVNTE